MVKPLRDFSIARDFKISKGRLANKVSFTCGACQEEVSAKVKPTQDEAGALFAGATCPSCSRLNSFSDKHGNYVSWFSRRGAMANPTPKDLQARIR